MEALRIMYLLQYNILLLMLQEQIYTDLSCFWQYIYPDIYCAVFIDFYGAGKPSVSFRHTSSLYIFLTVSKYVSRDFQNNRTPEEMYMIRNMLLL